MLGKAIVIAVKAHEGVMSQDGTPFVLHPMRLMMAALGTEDKIVAILHDTVEDTDVTLDSLKEEGFSGEVLAALDCVSRRQGEGYEDFIMRIRPNEMARRVKLLDLRDNIDLTRLTKVGRYELDRAGKYHRAIQYLEAPSVAEPHSTPEGWLA
jgi:hypothetical protein